jgi:DNA end-binding protein Ku
LPEDKHDELPRARAFWSGTITFGLVNIPVDLFAAVHGRRTVMKMVDADGEPLGRRYVCPRDDETLSAGDIVRGYETAKGKLVVVTDEELESVAPEMSRDIELRRFLPLERIAPAYFDRPYLLAPAGRSTRAYRLLAKTMQRTGRVGIGTFVMRGHQYLVAILSDGGLLRAETLRFAGELRTPADVGLPKPVKAGARTVKALEQAIAALERDALDEEEMADRYAEEIRSLAEAKAKKRKDVIAQAAPAEEEDEEPVGGGNVIDLMQVLRDRLAAKARVKKATASPDRPRKAAPEGKQHAKEAASVLMELSKEDLYQRAQDLGIAGRSKMSKKALLDAVSRAT